MLGKDESTTQPRKAVCDLKLISILRAMDERDTIIVNDEYAPIDKMELFKGNVKDCKKQSRFRNGVVGSLCACHDVLIVGVDIEYQNRERR